MNVPVQERPPFVTFEYRPVEDRAASMKTGKYTTRDVPFALITRPGSKDTHVEEAEVWLEKLAVKARQDLVPHSWADGFRQRFEQWKKGEEPPVDGTPIKGWAILGPSAQQLVIQAGFKTVEDLAAASDAEVSSIGTGAIDLRQKARYWLEQASSTGKIVEEIAGLKTQLADLIRINQEQAAALAIYKASEKK